MVFSIIGSLSKLTKNPELEARMILKAFTEDVNIRFQARVQEFLMEGG